MTRNLAFLALLGCAASTGAHAAEATPTAAPPPGPAAADADAKPGPGQSQTQSQSQSPGAVDLERVVVVGQRHALANGQVSTDADVGVLGTRSVFDTPFSISSYTDQLIRDQQARTLTDVLDNDASVRSASGRYSESQFYAIRGFTVYSDSILFDGVPGITDYRAAELDGIERVDVFKGPSALANNAVSETSVGGTVNLVPKRATDAPVNHASVGYGTKGVGEAHLDLGRRFGEGHRFGARLNLGGRDGETPIDRQREKYGNAALALDYRGEKLRLSYDGGYQSRTLTADQLLFTVDPGIDIPRAPDPRRNVTDADSRFRKNAQTHLLQGEYDLTPRLTAFAGYGHVNTRERFQDAAASSVEILNADNGGVAPGDANVALVPFLYRITSDIGRAGLRGRFTTGPVDHRVTASFDGYWTREFGGYTYLPGFNTNIYDPPPPSASTKGSGDPADGSARKLRRTSAVLADVATALDGRLVLIGGVRRQTLASRNLGLVDGSETGYDRARLSPSGAALYKLTSRWSVYGNYVEALQSGPTAPLNTTNANETLPPLVSRQVELGSKLDLGTLGVTLAAFQISEPFGVVVPNAAGTGLGTFAASGRQRNRGLELSVFGTVARGVRVIAGGSLIDPVLLGTNDATTERKKANGVPRATLNTSGEWDLPWVPRLTATALVVYTDRQFYDASDARGIPSWTRVDLGARYARTVAGRDWTLRAAVQNVADRHYWSSAQVGYLAQGAPRTLLVSLSTDW